MVPQRRRRGAQDTQIAAHHLRPAAVLPQQSRVDRRHHRHDRAGSRHLQEIRRQRIAQLPGRHPVHILGAVPQIAFLPLPRLGLRPRRHLPRPLRFPNEHLGRHCRRLRTGLHGLGTLWRPGIAGCQVERGSGRHSHHGRRRRSRLHHPHPGRLRHQHRWT